MQELQANTEVKVRIGPFVDVTDGFTPETGITLGAADEAELLKHNGAATVDISSNTWAAVTGCDGWYDLTLTTTDTNTEGMLTVVVQDDSVCLPVHVHFMVLAQAAWLSKYTAKDSGYMDVNVKAVSQGTAAADNLESACNNYSATRGLAGTALPAAAADAAGGLPISDAGGLDLDTILGRITANVATEAKQDTIDTVVDAIKAITDNLPDSGALTTLSGYVDDLETRLTATRAGYLDELAAANIPADIDTLKGYCDILDHATNGLANIKSLIDTVDTVVDAIKAKTDNLPADPADDSDIDSQLSTIAGYCDIIDTVVDAVKAKTDNLPADPADDSDIDSQLSTIDTVVDAIKAKTDLLPSGVPKNTALSNFVFLMVLSSDHVTPATGKTITEEISKDGGAFAACTNAASEIGNGFYKIDLTQTEMNADVVALKFTETDCDQRSIVLVTST